MKVLVACEYSGRVRDAFEQRGHDAVSCDLLPTETQGNHYQGDVRDILTDEWDLMVAHPPCTYLSSAGNAHLKQRGRAELREAAVGFVMMLAAADIPRICIENPVGYLNRVWRKPDQIIQPYFFGESAMKTTCLWLKNLPKLRPTQMLEKPQPLYYRKDGKAIHYTEGMRGGKDRAKERARTFKGIADAMAEQWGVLS